MQDYVDLLQCQLVDENANWVFAANPNSGYKIGDKLLVENPTNPKKIEKAIVVSMFSRAPLNSPSTNFILSLLGYENQSKLKNVVGKLDDSINFDNIELDLSGITI